MAFSSTTYGLGAAAVKADRSEEIAAEAQKRIKAHEARGITISKQERLQIIAQVMREKGLDPKFDSPQKYDPKMPGYAKDFELIDFSQTPSEQVAAAFRNTVKFGSGLATDSVKTTAERLKQVGNVAVDVGPIVLVGALVAALLAFRK